MQIGYKTSGLTNHDMFAGISLLVERGYKSVAFQVDHGWLSPFEESSKLKTQQLKSILKTNGVSIVIETGARFLLNPARKHSPTLTSPDETEVKARGDFYRYCIDLAEELESNCVSIFSGPKPDGTSFPEALDRFTQNLSPILDYANQRNVQIAVEPVPGMLIDNTGRFERLAHLVDANNLALTLDVVQLFCTAEIPISNYIERWSDYIANVHVADARSGSPDHLMFSRGQMYFPPILEALAQVGYQGGIHVELGRDSYRAVESLNHSFEFLAPLLGNLASQESQQP